MKYHLRVPAQGIDVPVYAGESEDQALERAFNTVPELKARAERQRAAAARGDRGRPLEELLVQEGMSTERQRSRGRRLESPGDS